ncbi:ankyrin repeat-containing domain protein [Rostrohypoxylon terebratum]|nr:ankyrin repeat-containing domain protein [Rostrohypoxylon terebratum]
MHLFDFSPEVLELIFERIAYSRDLARFMRLRFVSRQFKLFVDNAIFRHHLLAIYGKLRFPDFEFKEWQALMIEYLAFHVWTERKATSLRGRIRRAAVAISEQVGETDEVSVKDRIKRLCRLAYDHAKKGNFGKTLFYINAPEPWIDPPQPNADLCVAAVYLGYRSIAEPLISQHYRSSTSETREYIFSRVFGYVFDVALYKGDLSMAASYGHKDIFDFALDSSLISQGLKELKDIHLDVEDEYESLSGAISATENPDIYKRGVSILDGRSERIQAATLRRFYRMMRVGNADIIRSIFENPPWPKQEGLIAELKITDTDFKWILRAIEGGNSEIVKMFIDHGAALSWSPAVDTPLMLAARLSRITIAKLLIEAGVEIDEGYPPPIILAVWKEDMAMFRLLRRYGARLDTPETGNWAMAIAQANELESMVDVLADAGVERGAILHRCRGLGEVYDWKYLVSPQWKKRDEAWLMAIEWR